MAHYINKAAVVAEIEREIEFGKLKCQQSQENNDQVSYIAWSEHIASYGKMLSFINTLGVKEVDLEREINEQALFYNYALVGTEEITAVAKHFFELGLKTQKGE